MSATKPKLYLLDGHSHLYKAYHAVSGLSNSSGEPTGAVFGFLQIFQRIRRDYQPEHIAVVFDPPGPSFRGDLFPEYKANRPPQPEDLTVQVRTAHELLAAMRVPVFEVPNFEADDVIATLARWAVENGGEAVIVSVDKDLLQCVRPGITVLREHLGSIEMLDEAGVEAKLGVRPAQVAPYLGLLGDSADNIPGVPGVGKKRAAELLAEFGSLDAILAEATGKTKPKFWASLAENAEKARFSTQLATVRQDVPIGTSWDALRWKLEPSEQLRAIARRLEFRQLTEELGGDAVHERQTDYATILTREQLQAACSAIRAAGAAAIDTETTGLDPYASELVGISLSWRQHQAVYIPVGGDHLPLADVRAGLDPVFREGGVKWTAHNWRFDCKILSRAGFSVDSIEFDTMIASYLHNTDRSTNALKPLALEMLGIKMTTFQELTGGGGGDMITIDAVDLERASNYACLDADATFQLRARFAPALEEAGLRPLFDEVEMPLVPVLSRMELEGVRIDREYFAEILMSTESRLLALTREIHGMAGRVFNINSPQQLADVLFVHLNLNPGRKTTTGFSTDAAVLEELAEKHPFPSRILEYRQLEKLRGTYIQPLPALVNPHTGRIHSSFHQTVAATGRLSSSEPNLQNIPVRTEDGRQIRRGFIPRQDGWRFLAADYSQIELRILAHLSGDEALREAFQSGQDIHALTASKVFNVPLEGVSKEMRSQSKAINFGIIYGMGAFRLSKDLGISQKAAEEFIANYFRVYGGVRRYLDETLENCRREGFVKTMRGRRRFIPDIKSSNHQARAQAERVAVNTPIQGSSADMIKLAMIAIDRRIRAEGLRSRMILQVHDELIFDAPEEELGLLEPLVREEMRRALPLAVPVQVDVETGLNWAEV
ncbi:DNA polymerase I [Candidatus Poribacteria bacterium]|nr:DNA polymerase I [Candidatus Poribacteria bacterium]